MATNQILGPVSKPNFNDVLNRTKSDIFFNLNCVQVGSIISYNPAKNTASIQIAMKRQMPTGEVSIYPPLQDCPVVVMSGGKSFISLPIKPGDPCLVFFNDRDIDTWWATGETNVPATSRAHSLSDGFALVGIRNQSNKLDLNDTIVLVDAGDTKIAIKNDAVSLKTLIDQLIDTIKLAVIDVSGTTGAINPATQALLDNSKAQFDLLLDGG